MVMVLSLIVRDYMQTRLFLVAMLAIMLVFSAYSATEFSHVYAVKKNNPQQEKPTHKTSSSSKKYHALGKPIGRH